MSADSDKNQDDSSGAGVVESDSGNQSAPDAGKSKESISAWLSRVLEEDEKAENSENSAAETATDVPESSKFDKDTFDSGSAVVNEEPSFEDTGEHGEPPETEPQKSEELEGPSVSDEPEYPVDPDGLTHLEGPEEPKESDASGDLEGPASAEGSELAGTKPDPSTEPIEFLLASEATSEQTELGGIADETGLYDEFTDGASAVATSMSSQPEVAEESEVSPNVPNEVKPTVVASLIPPDGTAETPTVQDNTKEVDDSREDKAGIDDDTRLFEADPPTESLKPAKLKDATILPETKIETDNLNLTTTRKPRKSSPGGDLRELEQVLARSAPGKIPAGFEKRATLAIRFLFTISGVERALVVVESETEGLKALASGGVEEESGLEATVPRAILRSVLSSKNTELLLDASKDSRFSRAAVVKDQGIRSILCVHFTDKIGGVQGLLYADSLTEPSIFSAAEKKKVEEFAQQLATEDILEFERELEPLQSQELQVETQPFSPWIAVGGALLALVFVLPSLTKSEPKPAPTPTSTLVSHETADASVLLNSYIRSLAASNYQGAYSLLSDEVREKLTLQQYEEKMRAFFAQENNTVQFANAGITSKSSSSETRKIYSLQPPRRDLGPWECVMVRADGVWYISRIEGGPSVP